MYLCASGKLIHGTTDPLTMASHDSDISLITLFDDESRDLNENIQVKIEPKMPRAMIPCRSYKGSAAYDVFYAGEKRIKIQPKKISPPLPLGFAMEMPKGYYAQLLSRSGWAVKAGIEVVGSPSIIDQDFRGSVAVSLRNNSEEPRYVSRGTSIAQMTFHRNIDADFCECEKLSASERGSRGFGSSGES